jgi:stress-induced morphogen
LSGNTAEAIQKVDPEFIKIARIDQSLTPGRNNGFLNMLHSMKQKATQLDEAARNGTTSAPKTNDNDETLSGDDGATDEKADAGGEAQSTKYTAITESLQALKPESFTVVDTSELNGSAEGAETYFELSIVASAFEGLNVIKRQQLVFMILGDLMPQIEGLQIASMFTPEEVKQQS